MTSHELARALLDRRDNDLIIEVLFVDDPSGETYGTRLVNLRPDDDLIDDDLRAEPVVRYDSLSDRIVIAAGSVSPTTPEED